MVYINGDQLDINPAEISFCIPTRTAKYNLINQGEIEELKGINLEKIELKGILPSQTIGRDDNEPRSAQEYIDQWTDYAKRGQPVRFIYIGQNWDINMLCSIQSPQWHEIGGCFDVEYTLTLHRWKSIRTKQGTWQNDGQTRDTKTTQAQNGATYTVKQGDTLSHIAKCLLGDSSRWREIYTQNQNTIKDPNKIYVGQVILLPDGASGMVSQRTSSSTKNKQSTKKTSTKKNTSKKPTSESTKAPSATISKVESSTGKGSYMSAGEIFNQYRRKR